MLSARCCGLLAALTVMATACSSSSSGAHPQVGTTLPAVSSCPTPSAATATFPAGPASRLPRPAFAQAAKYLPTTVTGERTLQFTTAMSLAEAASFVRSKYPAAGYRLVGGDAEKREADIEWAHSGVTGRTRLSAVTGCSTTWTILTVTSQH